MVSENKFSPESNVEKTSLFNTNLIIPEENIEISTEIKLTGVENLPIGTALLVVKRGPNAGSRFILDKSTTTAGRHPESDIFLDDVTVSRKHAEFNKLLDGNFQVQDVGSLNGTYVNKEAVTKIILKNGDEVQIGKFRLIFLMSQQ